MVRGKGVLRATRGEKMRIVEINKESIKAGRLGERRVR